MPKEKLALAIALDTGLPIIPWLKLIAFILAVMVWFYVKGE